MDFELWWLLPIPALFFAMGWIAARIDIKHLLRESRALPLSYFRGLNFLLNEQPDKAIESFIEVVKVDPQTIDLHFALGSLFRRQGEIDRAIRMHQNLLDRPDLPADKRQTAMFELAQDFHRAGLLDRAEELFTQARRHAVRAFSRSDSCSRSTSRKRIGRRRLPRRERMEALAKQPYFKEIAHYYCELAQNGAAALAVRRRARSIIEQALAEYKLCARATMLLGDVEAQRGRSCRRDRGMAADRVAEPGVSGAGRRPSRRRLPQDWRRRAGHSGAAQLRGAISVARPAERAVQSDARRTKAPQPATQLIKDELARNPTLLGLDRLLEAQLLAAPAERRHDLELVKGLVGQHIKRLGMYRCEHCGFRAKQYYWRCPGCGKWETYSPRRTESPDGFA